MKTVLTFLRPVLLLLAILFLGRLLSQIGFELFVATIKTLSIFWVLLTLVCIVSNFACAARRYQALVAPEVAYLKVLEAVMASFLLNYASLVQGVGIGAKIGLMKARGIPASRSLAGILTEISFDLVFTLIVAAIYFYSSGFSSEFSTFIPNASWLISVVCIIAAVALFLAFKFSGFLNDLRVEFIAIIRSGRLAGVIVSTFGIWLSAGLGFYCMLMALEGNNAIDQFLTLAAICIGYITGLVSMVPGGIGVREITWSYIVSQGGVALELAGLMAVFYRLVSILTIIFILLFWNYFLPSKKDESALPQ